MKYWSNLLRSYHSPLFFWIEALTTVHSSDQVGEGVSAPKTRFVASEIV